MLLCTIDNSVYKNEDEDDEDFELSEDEYEEEDWIKLKINEIIYKTFIFLL